MTSRVRIGTCAGIADAALVRSVFGAHDIEVVIGSGNNAGVLGGLGGSFLALDIVVAEADAEEAVALLHDLREGGHEAPDDPGDVPALDPRDPERDERADAEGHWGSFPEAPEADAPGSVVLASTSPRRRRAPIALLLAFCVSFGTAHMFTGAWLRGMALAGIEVLGIRYLRVDPGFGAALIIGAVLCDAAGAIWRIWSAPGAAAPATRGDDKAPR